MLKTIRIAGIVKESVNDGEGFRYVIFTQGCPHKCDDCHNKHTWSMDGGYEKKIDTILKEIETLSNHYTGITFSGGEPFLQEKECCYIAEKVKNMSQLFNIWTYTGYKLEELNFKEHPLLSLTDFLVDGKFEKDKVDIYLPYRGSSNQRVINMNHWRYHLNKGDGIKNVNISIN